MFPLLWNGWVTYEQAYRVRQLRALFLIALHYCFTRVVFYPENISNLKKNHVEKCMKFILKILCKKHFYFITIYKKISIIFLQIKMKCAEGKQFYAKLKSVQTPPG